MDVGSAFCSERNKVNEMMDALLMPRYIEANKDRNT